MNGRPLSVSNQMAMPHRHAFRLAAKLAEVDFAAAVLHVRWVKKGTRPGTVTRDERRRRCDVGNLVDRLLETPIIAFLLIVAALQVAFYSYLLVTEHKLNKYTRGAMTWRRARTGVESA
jgi:hypothetical protein